MALSGGSVDPGDGSGTGLAKVMYDAFAAEFGPFHERARRSLAPFCTRLAGAIVDYFKANTVVTVTVPASAAGDGLQTSTAIGFPTDAPATAKSITGSIA